MTSQITSVVVLAAGQGKRMRSGLPKVLHRVCGRPMLLYVLEAAQAVGAAHMVVVLGHGREQVVPYLPADCTVAIQDCQLGTGHALAAAADVISAGTVLVLPGDTPLITGAVLEALVAEHEDSGAAATVLTTELDDPTGYGRVVRGADGAVLRIVEQRDAEPEELAIREVNSGIYVLPAPLVFQVLSEVGADNDQGEIYLTDVIAGLRSRGEDVAAFKVADPSVVMGVNSPDDLLMVEALMARCHRDDG